MSDPQVGPVFASFDDVTIRLMPVSWIAWDMACWTPKPSGDDWRNPDNCFRWIEGDCSTSLVVDVFKAGKAAKRTAVRARSAPRLRRRS